ncbi:MAG: ABC transporter ATP-binding protein [Verrucomicrobia bacterium]|jgi:ABC-2 type transport system ATP-binding protein|nr:ABC transporter ATP-binding protein [Verrucomicrobiota bacterium]
MSENAIEIRDLRKKFSKFQLGPLDLDVPKGAIYGFVGPNGAGKTTTLDLMFGMGRRDSGQISLLGLDSETDEVAVKQKVAYASPDLNYQVWSRVKHVIQFIRGFYQTWDQAYCTELLQRFKISETDKITALSFGNKIKLALVMALARRPEIIVLDEPTVGLDALSKREVFAQLLALMKDGEHTVLISSHSLSDLERFTDHIGVINDGKMILEGRTDELLASYRHLDFDYAGEIPKGGKIIHQDGTRYRILTDEPAPYEAALASRGASGITAHPVNLEELFIGLVEGRQQ